MKKYEKYQYTSERYVETVCDLCGRKTTHYDNWAMGAYELKETKLKFRWGDTYPDGGSGSKYEIDICPDCFRNKLISWLESQGCKVESKEWDW